MQYDLTTVLGRIAAGACRNPPKVSERGNTYVQITSLIMAKPRDEGFIPQAIFCPLDWSDSSGRPYESDGEALRSAFVSWRRMMLTLAAELQAEPFAANDNHLLPANDNPDALDELLSADARLKAHLARR